MQTSDRPGAFQSLMRAWSGLAPYNFIHAMRLPEGPADVERWQRAAEDALRALELESPVSIETPQRDIDSHLEAELNRPFGSGDLPMRFFAIDIADGGHWFGVALDHWLADDFSSRALLHRMYSFYQSPGDARARPPLQRTNVSAQDGGWLPRWSGFIKQALTLRRAIRFPLRDAVDLTVGTFRTQLPEGALEAIRRLARGQRATVHDVFLAAAAQTLGAYRAPRPGDRRDGVGLVSAMDLRRFEIGEAKTGFGFLISQFITLARRPQEMSLAELTARLAAQTGPWKTSPHPCLVAPALVFWRLCHSQRDKATLFQRGAPLSGVLSNVNLTGSWIEQNRISDFRRVGPTGPAVPMLFMITTLHGRILVDVTFRRTAFSRHNAQVCAENFVRRLSTC